MIQRIQSLYLFLAALAVLFTYFSPIAIFISVDQSIQLFACHIETFAFDNYTLSVLPMTILSFIVVIGSVVTIFLFNNRKLQIKLGRIYIILLIVTIALAGFYFYSIQINTNMNGQPAYASAMYIVALLFLWLAIKGIKKDEALVRSADRIR